MPVEKYIYLRKCELEAVLREGKSDIKEGRIFKESVDKHIKRITRDVPVDTGIHDEVY